MAANTRPDPVVIIGLRLSIEPKFLPESLTHPLNFVLTARVIKTPKLDVPVTFYRYPSPFSGPLQDGRWTHTVLVNEGTPSGPIPDLSATLYHSETDTTHPLSPSSIRQTKRIETGKRYNFMHSWTGPDLGAENCLTVPPHNQGTLVWKQEVYPEIIAKAGIKAGERYRVSMANKYRFSRWWAFGNLEGQRPKSLTYMHNYKNQSDEEIAAKYERDGFPEIAEVLREPIEEAGAWKLPEDGKISFVFEDDGAADTAEFVVVGDPEMSLEDLKI